MCLECASVSVWVGPPFEISVNRLTCSLARSAGRSGPEGFVGLTGLAAPALLGWGLRVTVCAWSVSVWVGPL